MDLELRSFVASRALLDGPVEVAIHQNGRNWPLNEVV